MTDALILDVEELAKLIGCPVDAWNENCYNIAVEAVNHGIPGVPRYGHYLGEVHPDSMFYTRWRSAHFVQHGWVALQDERVWDPTRWTLDGSDPYIYVGNAADYDVGGNKVRTAMMGHPPEFDASQKTLQVPVSLSPVISTALQAPTDVTQVSFHQLHWLANNAPEVFGPSIRLVYAWLKTNNLNALVPIDNWRLIMGDDDG